MHLQSVKSPDVTREGSPERCCSSRLEFEVLHISNLSFFCEKAFRSSYPHRPRITTTTSSPASQTGQGCLKQSFLLGSLISAGSAAFIHDRRAKSDGAFAFLNNKTYPAAQKRGKGQVLGYTSSCLSSSLSLFATVD